VGRSRQIVSIFAVPAPTSTTIQKDSLQPFMNASHFFPGDGIQASSKVGAYLR
jgi:hypothetical protein